MIKFKYIDGCLTKAVGRPSSTKFPPSIVEPDDAYTIRQIYDCWRKGKPTSVHPFNAEFDEEGSKFDDSDHDDDFRENPCDISQVDNDFKDARDSYVAEYEDSRRRKKKAAAPSGDPTPEPSGDPTPQDAGE